MKMNKKAASASGTVKKCVGPLGSLPLCDNSTWGFSGYQVAGVLDNTHDIAKIKLMTDLIKS